MMTKLSFHRRPMPIFAEYRPMYKMSLILLVLLLSSRSGKSSFIRLHLFNWALKDDKRKDLLLKSSKDKSLDLNIWGFDPSLNIAVQFALAEKLVERDGGSIMMTSLGKEYTKKLFEMEIMKDEASFLVLLGKGITESMVSQASESWR